MDRHDLAPLDLTPLPPDVRGATAAARLEELEPGEGLQLTLNADPADVLHHLQENCPHAFDWWPLEAGPDRWRVHLGKNEDDPEEPRSILDVMAADHRRLNHLYGQLSAAFDAEDLEQSRGRLAELRLGLGRHAQAEEDMLLPLLAAHGGPHGAKDRDSVHEDHRRMSADFAVAQNALDSGGADAIARAREALTDLEGVMRGHHRNEERVLYPVCDKAAKKAGTQAELIARIQAM